MALLGHRRERIVGTVLTVADFQVKEVCEEVQ